jgi:RecJ-like exonuclease
MSGSVMCNECDGQGYVMIGPQCDLPASMCCGGCFKKVECDKCNGKGYEKQETENEDGE